MEELPAS